MCAATFKRFADAHLALAENEMKAGRNFEGASREEADAYMSNDGSETGVGC